MTHEEKLEDERESLCEISEYLSDAFDGIGSAVSALKDLPEDDRYYDQEALLDEAECLMESLSKALEDVNCQIGGIDSEEDEIMRRDSYNW